MELPKVMERALKYDRAWQDALLEYKNHVIEPYVFSLWSYSFDLVILREYLPVLQDYNNRSIRLLEELRSLMQIIVEANAGTIVGEKFVLREQAHLDSIRDNAEQLLTKRLDEFDPREFLMMWFDLTPEHIVKAWEEKCLYKIPNAEDIEAHEDGHFDTDSLLHHIDVLSTAIEETRAIQLYSDDQLPIAFLLYAKRLGVPMTNAAYRDLYQFMTEYDIIPKQILESHANNTQRYVKENYIKAIYRNNPWMNNFPPKENYIPEDLDKYKLKKEDKK